MASLLSSIPSSKITRKTRRTSSAAKPPTSPVVPHSIVLSELSPELCALLSAWIAGRWPNMTVLLGNHNFKTGEGAVLTIVDCQPRQPCSQPTLWLADLERKVRQIKLSPNCWQISMPLTAQVFCKAVERCIVDS
jgi:hypothetical protein